jgi:hypothetical protein
MPRYTCPLYAVAVRLRACHRLSVADRCHTEQIRALPSRFNFHQQQLRNYFPRKPTFTGIAPLTDTFVCAVIQALDHEVIKVFVKRGYFAYKRCACRYFFRRCQCYTFAAHGFGA